MYRSCHHEPVTELVLGTAQWGDGYGITNQAGRLDELSVAALAEEALRLGVVRADTAAGYGDAQQRLRPWADRFAITTKVPGAEPGSVSSLVRGALVDLGLDRVQAVLLHDWEALPAEVQRQAATAMEGVREEGLCPAVGVSVYTEAGLITARAAFDRLDVVQVPANALDRRLEGATVMAELAEDGTGVQVRSVLLQGLLAGSSSARLSTHPDVQRWLAWVREQGQAPLVAALGHVKALPWAREVIVGVTSADELRAVVQAWDDADPRLADARLASEDLDLVDPRRWTA